MSVILVSWYSLGQANSKVFICIWWEKIKSLYNLKTIPLYMSANLCTESIEVIDDFLNSGMNTQLYLKYKFKVLWLIKENSWFMGLKKELTSFHKMNDILNYLEKKINLIYYLKLFFKNGSQFSVMLVKEVIASIISITDIDLN